MMGNSLAGDTVAILVTDGFEQVELTEPRAVLEREGATVHIVSPRHGIVLGWEHDKWGDEFPVDAVVDEASADFYDALVLPGGVMNPDNLRMDAASVAFVRDFFEQGKPVAAICHGAWTLIEAGVTGGRRLTSYPSLQTDLENAGATWVDEAVVSENGLVTSRRPDDLDAFNKAMLHAFSDGAGGD